MARVTAFREVAHVRRERTRASGHRTCRTDIIKQLDPDGHMPEAFLAEGSAGHVLCTHYHVIDQFQVVYKGDGTLGRHRLAFGDVHFARAYTPYGPILHGEKEGLGFITLRAHHDPGGKDLPEARTLLESVTERKPWQVSATPDFRLEPAENGVAMKAIEQLKDERGLGGYSLVMKAGATAYSIDPSRSDGQYLLVLKGGIVHEGNYKEALTVVWVEKNEPAFKLVAGPEGAEILILNFPIPGGGAPQPDKVPAVDRGGAFKTYQCILCAFVYDEARGDPASGIAPGTRWAEVPDSFTCPDCGATKSDFEMIEL